MAEKFQNFLLGSTSIATRNGFYYNLLRSYKLNKYNKNLIKCYNFRKIKRNVLTNK